MPCDIGHGVKPESLLQRLIQIEDFIMERRLWYLDDPHVKAYYDIVQKSKPEKHCPLFKVRDVCSALEGHRGYYIPQNLKKRISESTVKLTDLMITFIMCDYDALYETILYLDRLDLDDDSDEIDVKIMDFQNEVES